MTVADGELDLLARDERTLVAIEVRTTGGPHDPIDAVDRSKRRRVKRLAARVGAGRVDFLGVRVAEEGVDFHWVQN